MSRSEHANDTVQEKLLRGPCLRCGCPTEATRDVWQVRFGSCMKTPRCKNEEVGQKWVYATTGGWLGPVVKVGRTGFWPGKRARETMLVWPIDLWGVRTDLAAKCEAAIKRTLGPYVATRSDLPRHLPLMGNGITRTEYFNVPIDVALAAMREVTGQAPEELCRAA